MKGAVVTWEGTWREKSRALAVMGLRSDYVETRRKWGCRPEGRGADTLRKR